jgi:hypothetical protein
MPFKANGKDLLRAETTDLAINRVEEKATVRHKASLIQTAPLRTARIKNPRATGQSRIKGHPIPIKTRVVGLKSPKKNQTIAIKSNNLKCLEI